MPVNEESSIFSMGQGCPVHGDEYLKECNMCGAEFCRICFPRTAVCPDCADQEGEEELDGEDAPDFDDVSDLDKYLDDDEEAEKAVRESEEEPPPEGVSDDLENR
jgi:hypothetical protein